MGVGIRLGSNCLVCRDNCDTKAPNPNPINFEIIGSWQIGYHVVASIKYPDCTNFEGVKTLVFRNMERRNLYKMTEIDPHFSERLDSPVARFLPTDEGLEMACNFAQSLS